MNNAYDKPEFFLNREMSWLSFNRRVLQEADDKQKPVLERLKFIAITSSNLDEFFMIRVAGLKQQLESGINKIDSAGMTVSEQLASIADLTQDLVKLQYRFYKKIIAQLTEADIFIVPLDSLTEKEKEWTRNYFLDTIYPVITPLAVDASHPFPFLSNRSLNIAISLAATKGENKMAVVQVPAVLPRLVEVATHTKKKKFVFLEDIIKAYCQHLFVGHKVRDMAAFRITRNADLFIDEEDAEDLLAEVEKSLRQRKHGEAVRLEIDKAGSRHLREAIIDAVKVGECDVYDIPGPIDVTCFMKFADLAGYEKLRYAPFVPQTPAELLDVEDLYAAIRERDVLIHHPYESFEPVIEFVRRAATDPQVLAIKQTLYRVSGNSPIVRALAQAAENGKQVTVLVELKARFDEENNILWARRLEEAGCHVIYGLVGLKTHSKICLIVRRESTGIKRYVHLATGNYNDATARGYTDMGLFTANDQYGADASAFFNMLSGYSDPPVWNKFVVAPLGLRRRIIELLDREIHWARAGKPARIIAKMNSLLDKEIVKKLYEASTNGVKIDLIVRGICVLLPGIKGVSENITVRSIVGRFLEHSRMFYFANGGDEKVFLSSADWMPRNLDARVELLFPIDDERHIERIKTVFDIQLSDTERAQILRSDGTYRKLGRRSKGEKLNSQVEMYRLAKQAAYKPEMPLEQRLKPMYRKEE
ncbi:MAG: ppk [Anaerosporomusa subterranea]|jgi:polyphosphate kinase|nr:ppk [Anaerosporomusa subterranea]